MREQFLCQRAKEWNVLKHDTANLTIYASVVFVTSVAIDPLVPERRAVWVFSLIQHTLLLDMITVVGCSVSIKKEIRNRKSEPCTDDSDNDGFVTFLYLVYLRILTPAYLICYCYSIVSWNWFNKKKKTVWRWCSEARNATEQDVVSMFFCQHNGCESDSPYAFNCRHHHPLLSQFCIAAPLLFYLAYK